LHCWFILILSLLIHLLLSRDPRLLIRPCPQVIYSGGGA
jgi:hypothetical protein